MNRAYAVASIGVEPVDVEPEGHAYAVANIGVEPVDGSVGARAYALAGDVTTEDPLLAVKAWDGDSWEARPLRVWNGKGWVRPESLTYWDGSSWVVP